MMNQIVAGIAVACVIVTGAQAKAPARYTFYTVSGSTAAAVMASMARKGPVMGGALAYAYTAPPKLSGTFVKNGGTCRFKDYGYNSAIVINLPKLDTASALSGTARQNWRSFTSFVKRHEDEHRAIYLRCAKELWQSVATISAPDCGAAQRAASRMASDKQRSCQRQHNALDTRDARALARHPFIRQAAQDKGRIAMK
jgi:predicted secreted Zn-dependent protease